MTSKQILLILLTLTTINTLQAQVENSQTETVEILPKAHPQQAAQDMQNAYKKEFAFLRAQVRSIEARTIEFNKAARSNKATINQQINTVENRLLALDNINNQLEDDIFQIERNTESASDNNNLLDATITQARSTLSEFDFDGFNDNSNISDIEKISLLITSAKDVIAKNSTITQRQGSFFLESGKEVTGTIINVGKIASYGHSTNGSGVLAPAGENKFKVWRDSDQQTVADLFSGNSSGNNSSLLPIFLYESAIKSIDEKQQKTILSVINSGGMIAWIITVLGALALILVLLRFWFLKKASSSTEKILSQIVKNIENKDMNSAIAVANSKKNSSSRVLYAVLRNITRDREHIEDIVSEAILHESGQLNRFGSLIMVVATVTPLLGLLGTVTGMITTFDIITEFGTGDPKALSSGISIALVTTEVGLAVAIPALLFGNILSGWAERIKDEMEKAALRVINVYKNTIINIA
ncbi:MAG: MotA/TolQ/ExbB proton channel family protein [Alcanivoracaceae bacterium]|nr:MotA/TolQ/ExbB proton channel family protein [Alcanivoracaceae bacterium]